MDIYKLSTHCKSYMYTNYIYACMRSCIFRVLVLFNTYVIVVACDEYDAVFGFNCGLFHNQSGEFEYLKMQHVGRQRGCRICSYNFLRKTK